MENRILEIPFLSYSLLRSAIYFAEFNLMNQLVGRLTRHQPRFGFEKRDHLKLVLSDAIELFKKDARLFTDGILPVTALVPNEKPKEHIFSMVKVIWDGLGLYRRRSKGQTAKFRRSLQDKLDLLPRYYRRNFHFQTEGYLSSESAKIYDHQVEMLFFGTADPMRRLILYPMKHELRSPSGRPLRILEVGCGTGSATRFLQDAFPRATITAVDLSEFYIDYARSRFSGDRRLNFLSVNAEELPFRNSYFDAVVSVFLFHELPRSKRRKVVEECFRVLKPGGFLGFVDSIQEDDRPEFNEALKDFPKNYHEPFYRDYTQDPMEKWFTKNQFSKTGTEFGFFSKVVWGNKATK